jgi:Putative zinc-finger
MPAACAAVREQLAEHAVGVLGPRERRAVERHIEWCAACRKEAGELESAAATLALALAPADVPPTLLGRVRAAIARVAHPSMLRRGTRSAAAVAIAAMVAISALGWGAVMAGRVERIQDQMRHATARRAEDLQRFSQVIKRFSRQLPPVLPTEDTRFGRLAPTAPDGGTTGGAAMELVLRSSDDFVMVQVNGLSEAAAPYSVWLLDDAGHAIRAGRLTALDQGGGAEMFHRFALDLEPYSTVLVRDASGGVALRGIVGRT